MPSPRYGPTWPPRRPEGVTDVGLFRPDAGLLHPHGSATTLHAALGDRAPPQVFCWGAWCRCGTIALRRYQAELVTELTSRGVGLAAVCRSALDGSVNRHEKNELASTSLAGPREHGHSMSTASDGRVALVTGAGRGIGLAVALQLAKAGAQVALFARSADQLDETVATVRGLDGSAVVIPASLGDPDAVAKAAARVTRDVGPVDILVNNSTVVQPAGPTVSIEPRVWRRAFDVNLNAPVQLSLTFLPWMLERGWGRIVNVSSGILDGLGPTVGLNAYATTMAALETHSINLAAELADSGVTVNVYRPGSVETAMRAWFGSHPAVQRGTDFADRLPVSYEQSALISWAQSGQNLLARLASSGTGQIWTNADA